MICLKTLIAKFNHITVRELRTGIADEGIIDLNLRCLIADGNHQITNVNHMTNLEILHVETIPLVRSGGFVCGIGNDGIKNLNLRVLAAKNNPDITNVNHMTNLEKLYALGSSCGLTNGGIKDIRDGLLVLDATDNLAYYNKI